VRVHRFDELRLTIGGVAMLEWFVPPIVVPALAVVLIGITVLYHAL
jgi:hypothetical protein